MGNIAWSIGKYYSTAPLRISVNHLINRILDFHQQGPFYHQFRNQNHFWKFFSLNVLIWLKKILPYIKRFHFLIISWINNSLMILMEKNNWWKPPMKNIKLLNFLSEILKFFLKEPKCSSKVNKLKVISVKYWIIRCCHIRSANFLIKYVLSIANVKLSFANVRTLNDSWIASSPLACLHGEDKGYNSKTRIDKGTLSGIFRYNCQHFYSIFRWKRFMDLVLFGDTLWSKLMWLFEVYYRIIIISPKFLIRRVRTIPRIFCSI